MKVIKRKEANEYSNSNNCYGFEFDLGDKNLDGAVVNVKGRYPEKGSAMNEGCKEFAYIISGGGNINIGGKNFDIESEDMVVIDKGEHFYWEGEFRLFVYCTPAWSADQHKVVE